MDTNSKIVHGMNRAAVAGAARAAGQSRMIEKGGQDPKATLAVDARTPAIYSWPQVPQQQQHQQ
jgi:hypothetical protein